jgi:hypothetical protein
VTYGIKVKEILCPAAGAKLLVWVQGLGIDELMLVS